MTSTERSTTGRWKVAGFIGRCCLTLPIAFLFFPLALVLVFQSNGDSPVSGLDDVLQGWFIMFIMQFHLLFLWPLPLLIGVVAAGIWQWLSKPTVLKTALSDRAPS